MVSATLEMARWAACKAHDAMIARGVIHCHSSYSADSSADLQKLCTSLAAKGFDFVAMTEHAADMSPQDYEHYVRRCRGLTTPFFVVLPGLEMRSSEGAEIAGISLARYVSEGSIDEIIARIHEQGGLAIWVHPLKHGNWKRSIIDCDAIEVLNGKIDGTVAPSFVLLHHFRREWRKSRRQGAVFGLDLHRLDESFSVWVECRVESLTASEIVRAISQGEFVNRTPRLVMRSDGTLSLKGYCIWALLRMGYCTWNGTLKVSPAPVRDLLMRSSRPIVRWIKARN